MSLTALPSALPPEDFFERCSRYLQQLTQARGFEEVRQLWASTHLPYAMPAMDPLSQDYREHVLAIYRRLAHTDYQASNELTSTKQSAEAFQIGYPWVSKNCGVAASELAKTVQALNVVARLPGPIRSIVEFGSGWGNLALPLAKLGLDVAAVDIDQAFLDRLRRLVERDGFQLQTYCGDFVDVSSRLNQSYDVVVFQSSFHHCLEFDALLASLSRHVLSVEGTILFLAEPIHRDYAFPWGLRCDGESLWAIMCNHWLELGFDQDFFLALLLRHGFFVRRVEGLAGFVGEGWMATRSSAGMAFAECELPARYASSFWERASEVAYGRFLRASSELPPLPPGAKYRLTVKNFCPKPLRLLLRGDGEQDVKATIPPEALQEIDAPFSHQYSLRLRCETVVPDALIQNGDPREIGVALIRLATT
jgi:2-polyprenyl-3-methyl-5-hydroxy-6-metoxy-1,4-benzoquinol methylase